MTKIAANLSFITPQIKTLISKKTNELGFEAVFFDDNTVGDADLSEYEILFGYFDSSLLKKAINLKWYQCSFAGVDRFCDDDIFPDENVVLTNSSGAFGITISEHVITVLLMLMRNMNGYVENQKNSVWKIEGEIRSIYKSVVTIIGMGDIGSNIAKRLKAMGAYVKGVRKTKRDLPDGFDEAYTSENTADAVCGSDVIVLCVPGTDSTNKILSREMINNLNKNALVINVGRGNAIDEKALCEALNQGEIAGAALDVFEAEPLDSTNPIWQAKNCIITPHVSGNTQLPATREILINIFLDNLKRYSIGERLHNIVDRKMGY